MEMIWTCVLLLIVEIGQSLATSCGTGGDVRLVGGETEKEGRLEVCLDEKWSKVCGNSAIWDSLEGIVVCKQLGYAYQGVQYYVPNPSSIRLQMFAMYNINCFTFEDTLIECSHQIHRGTTCPSGINEVGVICIEGAPPTNLTAFKGTDSVTLSWSPPEPNENLIQTFSVYVYTATCSSTAQTNTQSQQHTIQAELGSKTLNTTIGPRLTDFDYECCVSADYPKNHHHKTCLMINHTELGTTNSTSPVSDAESVSSTIVTTVITSAYSAEVTCSSPSDTLPLYAVGCTLGIANLVLLIMFCVLLVYHNMKQKYKSGNMKTTCTLVTTKKCVAYEVCDLEPQADIGNNTTSDSHEECTSAFNTSRPRSNDTSEEGDSCSSAKSDDSAGYVRVD